MRISTAALCTALALGVPLFGCGGNRLASQTRHGTSASGPIFERPWSWTDETGETVVLSSYRGRPMLLTAMYTSCTVRCPFTVEKLRRVDAAFHARGESVNVVLVTLDPRNDTPERLRRFKESHHLPDNWHLLHGSDVDTHALARYLDVRAIYDDSHIDHDVQIGFFDSRGNALQQFNNWSFDETALVSAH